VAAECLSITGALSVPVKTYMERFALTGHAIPRHVSMDPLAWARKFSPVAVYRAVAEDHPVHIVRASESAALAHHVQQRFGLNGATAVIQRAGRIVLSLNAYPNSSTNGTFGYSHHWADGLQRDVSALARVLVGLLDFDGDLDELRMPISSLLNSGHSSRERIELTEDMTLVLYKNKVEVLLSRKAGMALNAFLGEWAPAAEAA